MIALFSFRMSECPTAMDSHLLFMWCKTLFGLHMINQNQSKVFSYLNDI